MNITQEQIDQTLGKLNQYIQKRVKKHGDQPFNSIWECYGKFKEESYELDMAVHKKNPDNIEEELSDIAVVVIWGLLSKEVDNQFISVRKTGLK
jgi:NTP pyrophosphatase (non-canonical NTP hydrolase)